MLLSSRRMLPLTAVTALGILFVLPPAGSVRAQPPQATLPTFDVASVKENRSTEAPYSNFPLNPGPQYGVEDGLLIGRNLPLLQYIVFAFKPDMFQIRLFRDQLPGWATTARFDIQARAADHPSKDEMRRMMQSLLAERFHMTIHHETRESPIYAVVFARPGRLGSELKPHPADDPTCKTIMLGQPVPGAYPVQCGSAASIAAKTPGYMAVGGYNVTMSSIAPALGGVGNITDRRVVDKTGLTGTFDFTLEFAPDPPPHSEATPVEASPELAGTTFLDAVKDQLGLKLLRENAPVDVIVIDRLDHPSED